VTKDGTDPMMSEQDNTANLVEPPTEIEMNHAITSNMKNLLVVVSTCSEISFDPSS
jgi:[calcium/calmodulin-dependent protein kinase] kinase